MDGDRRLRPGRAIHGRIGDRAQTQTPRRHHSGQASQAAPFPQGKGHSATRRNTGCPFRYFTRHTHSDADPHAGTYSDPYSHSHSHSHSHTETDFDPDPNSEGHSKTNSEADSQANAHSDTGSKAKSDSGARGDTQADSEAHCKTFAKTLSEAIAETLGKSIASSFPAQFAETLRQPPNQILPQDRW